MNQQIKEKWLSALRSRVYKQGQNYLKQLVGNSFHYCCLGVLCQIYADQEYKPFYKQGEKFRLDVGTDYSSFVFPPNKVLDYTQLDNNTEQLSHLVKMNDEQLASFDEIADYIEEKL